MRPVDIIVIIISLIGFYISLRFIFEGIKRIREGKTDFKIKYMFMHISFTESSGTLLLVEGITILLLAIIADLYWLRQYIIFSVH